jgi:nitrite reductase/ring-hydroxylating ferredoxin subunit
MTEVRIGRAEAFADPGRRVVEIDGVEIGVFRYRGKFTAFENTCPHLGGPACSGKLLPRATEHVVDGLTSQGRMFAKDRMNVVCPWHGYEFDIETGRHQIDERYRLRPVKVRVDGGDVFVTMPAGAMA